MAGHPEKSPIDGNGHLVCSFRLRQPHRPPPTRCLVRFGAGAGRDVRDHWHHTSPGRILPKCIVRKVIPPAIALMPDRGLLLSFRASCRHLVVIPRDLYLVRLIHYATRKAVW